MSRLSGKSFWEVEGRKPIEDIRCWDKKGEIFDSLRWESASWSRVLWPSSKKSQETFSPLKEEATACLNEGPDIKVRNTNRQGLSRPLPGQSRGGQVSRQRNLAGKRRRGQLARRKRDDGTNLCGCIGTGRILTGRLLPTREKGTDEQMKRRLESRTSVGIGV